VKNTSDGWFYQLTAPLKTLYNVRVTGQRSRGDLEFEDLKKYWETRQVSIKSVIFNFRLADQMREKDEPAPNKDYEPPLSWHLSQDDTRRIEDAWEANLRTQDRGWDSFRKVLACYRGYDNPNQCQSDEH
jgi:hypothetical protein